MQAFSLMLDRIFTDPVLSREALYLPQNDPARAMPVRVFAKQPDVITGFGATQLVSATLLLDVRVKEVELPTAGDGIVFMGKPYLLQSTPKADSERLVWTLDLRPL